MLVIVYSGSADPETSKLGKLHEVTSSTTPIFRTISEEKGCESNRLSIPIQVLHRTSFLDTYNAKA
jgi:hypothetical protein